MKILYTFITLLIFSLSVCSEDIKVTIHVDGDYRPFSYGERGVAKGMYIDVLKTAFSRMKGFDVTIKTAPWKRGKLMMELGEGFGLAPAFFHGHDWPYLFPYSLAFYTETIVSICRESVVKKQRPNWPQDYLGLSIGNVAGFDGWGGKEFRELVAKGKIKYEETKGSKEVIKKLITGRLDCIMMEDKAFDYTVRQMKSEKAYKKLFNKKIVKSAFIGKDPVYIGYSKTAQKNGKYPFQLDFMQAFDSEIYKMTKSGEIKKIMDSYTD